MNYRGAIRYILLFGLLAGVLGACGSGKSSQKHSPDPPNIVWIVSEDNSKHYIQLFDKNGVETPNIEKLADSGMTFTRAFSNAPVCSAARSTLIAGIYGPRIASHYHRRIKKVQLPETIEMFPYYLREAGYYTTNNAKEDYNIIKSEDMWDESSRQASWRNRKEGQPFFHVFNIGTTHEGHMQFSEAEMKSVKTLTNPDSVFVQPNHPKTEIFKYSNASYRDNIVTMDKEVGEVVEKLKNDELLESTIIFYFADHGGVLPGSKGYLSETGLHIPLVVYAPSKYQHLTNIKPGSRTAGFVSFVDFGATVLNLAGIEIPEEMNGKAFLGENISSEELDSRDETYSYTNRNDEKYDMVRAVRKGKYKYVRNYHPFNFDGLMNNYRYKQLAYKEWQNMYRNNELDEVESAFFEPKAPELLFDINADPFETNNLANDPEYSNTLKLMRLKLDSWMKELPDLSFFPEYYLIERAFDNPLEFGQRHKNDIKKYIEISNLMLLDFSSAKTAIKASLNSNDPWERYWGIVVCSSFGVRASEMVQTMKEVARTDPEYINRVRAAEFLGIVQAEDPSGVMVNALYKTKNAAEALLILNSIVLMRDGFGYDFEIQTEKLARSVKENGEVKQRLAYLHLF